MLEVNSRKFCKTVEKLFPASKVIFVLSERYISYKVKGDAICSTDDVHNSILEEIVRSGVLCRQYENESIRIKISVNNGRILIELIRELIENQD